MDLRTIFFCVSAVMIQPISGLSCLRSSVPSCSSGTSISASSSSGSLAVSNSGGPLIVTSVSPIVPTGIAVLSNLDLYGELDVNGCLPYITAVGFEAEMPTSGYGTVDYSCGSNTPVAITGVTGGGSLSDCGCRVY